MGDNPFYMLVKAARIMNPSQFELSKDIACTTPLPGSSKRVYGRNHRMPKKQAHELDGGLVPLPAKVCFVCTKSCRIGPLIQCDYCPLLFHMDCLNPPLTFLPTGRWMCPNHVEHFLDEYMVRTNSLAERVKLWDKYNGMVDQDAVKLRFLAKGHRKHPPFRVRVPMPARKTVRVPEAVKEHYKHPPCLLPQPEHPAQAWPEAAGAHKATYDATVEEQEEWLSAMVSLQTSIAKHMTQKQLQKTSSPGSKLGDSNKIEACSTAKPTASVAPVVQRDLDSSACSTVSSADSATKTADSVVNTEGVSSVGDGKGSAIPDSVNGPHELVFSSGNKSGAISLLHGNLGSSSGSGALNGDAEVLDVQKAKVEAAVRTRSSSADAAPGTPGVIKVSRASTDKPGSQAVTISGQPVPNAGSACQAGLPVPSSQQQLQTPQGKNILISTINKANNTVVTKVLPSPSGAAASGKVVLPSGVAARAVGGSPPTSILSPRVLVQPSMRLAGSSASGSGPQSNSCSVVGAGPQTKVISVSTSASGSKTAAVVSSGKPVASSLGSLPAVLSLNSALQQWIEGSSDGVPDLDLSKMDEKLLQLLAWQRLQQLLPPASPAGGGAASPTTPGRKGLLNGLLTPGSSEVRARAVLCPLTGKGQAVSMPYRTLNVGTGADMDVPLYQFGHCNFVSSKHAVIFYDEMTRHFELLNYSEHGTTVDNVLYSCDFSDKPATTPQPSPVVAAVRDIISKNNGHSSQESRDKRFIMSARVRESMRPCSCKSNSWNLIGGSGAGWEGTALLHHGSYIKLGCLQFVFSIVDQMPQELPPPARSKPSESMSLLKTHLKAM